jgi:hypothetical protein
VDLGYSYGNLPFMLSRGWFAAFGYTPWAYLGFLTLCNLLSVTGIAWILRTVGVSWWRLAAACVLLPLAVIPNNYSLAHPLEMMLIIWALAFQTRGRYGVALALGVLGVFTKPSMPYVLGLVLLIFGFLYPARRAGDQAQGFQSLGLRQRLRLFLRMAIPPTLTALAMMGISIWVMGLKPALANIIPAKAAAAYKQMDFGIFHAGKEFWLYDGKGKGAAEVLRHYLFCPASFWILASLLVWALGLLALSRLARGFWKRRTARGDGETPRSTDPLVLTIALLHAAFVFAFYAWAGSWTYYSYLLPLGLLVGLRGGGRQVVLLRVLVVLGALGLLERGWDGYSRWWGMQRVPEAAGLWAYPDELAEAQRARALARERNGLFLVNGALPLIWPDVQTPAVWFLSPGVLTAPEIDRVREQLRQANVVVLYKKYDQKQEAWKWPEFASERQAFELRSWQILSWTIQEKPLYEGEYFVVYGRHEK